MKLVDVVEILFDNVISIMIVWLLIVCNKWDVCDDVCVSVVVVIMIRYGLSMWVNFVFWFWLVV